MIDNQKYLTITNNKCINKMNNDLKAKDLFYYTKSVHTQ